MWLITGGCGFIGTNFIHMLIRENKEIKILNLDKLTYAGNIRNLKSIEKNSNYNFIKGSITNTEILEEIFRKNEIQVIINFAAESHVDRSIKLGDEFISTNIQGTHTLLKFARKYDTKFIQISTDEVYGSIKDGYFKETDKLNPSSIYSATKAGAEMLVNSYKKTYGLHTIITRSSNNFGPYQHPEKLIPRFITNLLCGKKVPLYGTGKNIRDWIYVEDNCRAINLVINKGKKGEIYNIGGGNEKTNIEITNIILKKLGFSDEMIEFVEDRLGHDFRYAIDSSKIKSLGWKPKYSFEEAFDLTINWYIENKDWWQPLID